MKSINYLLISLLISGLPFIGFSQPEDSLSCGLTTVDYAMLDHEPVFEGGVGMMYIWISENIKYPPSARDANIQGTVYVSFVVDTAGIVACVKVMRSVTPILDQAAMDLVSAMPRWTPGQKEGKNAAARIVLPIKFYLPHKGPSINSTEYLLSTANEFLLDQKFDKAIEYYDKVLNRDSRNIDALFNRSLAKRKSGDMKGACEDLNNAASLGDKEAIRLSDSLCTKQE